VDFDGGAGLAVQQLDPATVQRGEQDGSVKQARLGAVPVTARHSHGIGPAFTRTRVGGVRRLATARDAGA
jgi:hypothetical protein